MRRSLAGAVLAGVLVLVLTGCQGSSSSPAAARSSQQGSAESWAPIKDTPSSPAQSGTATKPSDCTADRLRITTGRTDALTSHRSIVVIFRNNADQACRLHGYPGVAALNRKGSEVAQAERTPKGFLGGLSSGNTPPTVDLAAGQTASALVEAVAPTCSVNQDPTCADQWYTGLLVTPPNDTRSVTLPWPGGDAGQLLQVHPVVPGDAGRT